MNSLRWCLAVMLGMVAGAAFSEDLDVITLKDGRVFEGHYNDITGVMRTMQGKVKVAVNIAPGDIASRGIRTIPDADDTEPAPAPAPVRAPVKNGDAAARAQRVEDLVARQKLVQELSTATEDHRACQAAIDQDEYDRKETPNLIKDLDQHIADARDQVDKDIVREAQITAANPGSQPETDARMQHDHDSAALAKLQSDEVALKKKLAGIDDELPGLRVKFKDSLVRQANAQAALDALDATAADDPLSTLTGTGAGPAPAPAGK